jgi:hypothetical protein
MLTANGPKTGKTRQNEDGKQHNFSAQQVLICFGECGKIQ